MDTLSDNFPTFQIELDFEESDQKFPVFNLQHTPTAPKPTQSYLSQQVNYSIFSTIGRRKSNLDKFSHLKSDEWELFAVYDGHSDIQISAFLAEALLVKLSKQATLSQNPQQALLDTFQEMEKQVVQKYEKGSTALVVMICRQTAFVASLGDSKLFGIRKNKSIQELTKSHNLSNLSELQDVIGRGGIVFKRGAQYRINGELNLSRCFGDRDLKYCLSSKPDIFKYNLEEFDQLVLATDGFYNAKEFEKRALLKDIKELEKIGIIYEDNATAIYFFI